MRPTSLSKMDIFGEQHHGGFIFNLAFLTRHDDVSYMLPSLRMETSNVSFHIRMSHRVANKIVDRCLWIAFFCVHFLYGWFSSCAEKLRPRAAVNCKRQMTWWAFYRAKDGKVKTIIKLHFLFHVRLGVSETSCSASSLLIRHARFHRRFRPQSFIFRSTLVDGTGSCKKHRFRSSPSTSLALAYALDVLSICFIRQLSDFHKLDRSDENQHLNVSSGPRRARCGILMVFTGCFCGAIKYPKSGIRHSFAI